MIDGKDAVAIGTSVTTAAGGVGLTLAQWQSIAGITAAVIGIVATLLTLYWRWKDRQQ